MLQNLSIIRNVWTNLLLRKELWYMCYGAWHHLIWAPCGWLTDSSGWHLTDRAYFGNPWISTAPCPVDPPLKHIKLFDLFCKKKKLSSYFRQLTFLEFFLEREDVVELNQSDWDFCQSDKSRQVDRNVPGSRPWAIILPSWARFTPPKMNVD